MSTMIPENVIETNKETFCTLLRQIRRDGAKIDDLIKKLESSDFFYAPASTKYHNSVKGGLCDHSLNVYYNLRSLVKNKHLESFISEETILICGLLHDISKINVYEESIRNKKVYHELGKKYDNLGNFDWVSEKTYQMKDSKDRFIYGNHEETSEYMIRKYIPLKLEESVAILTHHGSLSYDSVSIESISQKYERYPLACLLHVADMISTYIDEDR